MRKCDPDTERKDSFLFENEKDVQFVEEVEERKKLNVYVVRFDIPRAICIIWTGNRLQYIRDDY